jgi:hypothetical protein
MLLVCGKANGAAPVRNGPLGFIHPSCLLALSLFGLLGNYQTRFEEELGKFLQTHCLRYLHVQMLLDIFPSPTTMQPWPNTPFTPINFIQDETPLVSFSGGILRIISTAVQRIDSLKSLEDLDSSEFNGSLQGLLVCLYSEDRYTVIDALREITNYEQASCRAVHALLEAEAHNFKLSDNFKLSLTLAILEKGVKAMKTCHEFIQLNSRCQTRYSIRNVL